jgi:hypothetical protein
MNRFLFWMLNQIAIAMVNATFDKFRDKKFDT